MSGSINKVILVGNCVADPETRYTQSGDPICHLRLATNESWKDKATGEKKEKVEYHRVTIFNEHIATTAEKCLKKGSKVYIEGQIQTRKWQDKSGADKYSTEVVVNKFRGEMVMLDTKSSAPDRGPDPDTPARDGYDADVPF